jgi:hypothetical protein
MKKIYLLLFIVSITFNSFSQYNLSDEQLANGFLYLKKDAGFKNPSSVKLNGVNTSTFKFSKECFTWARYDISAQNSFGGYARNEFYVWFFDGNPFWLQEAGDYPAYPFAANSDKAADYLIGLATINYNDSPILTSKYCPGELEKIKQQEEERKILENKKREEDKIVLEKLNKLIEQNMIIEASNEYSKLYFKNTDIENKIQKGLDNIYGKETQDLEKTKVNQFINSNIESLNKMKSGSYLVKIDNQGQIFFGETDHSKDFSFSPITKTINSSFSVKINGTFTLNISDSLLNISKNEIKNSGTKYIQWSVNPKYEKSTLLVKIKMDGDNLNYIENDQYFFSNKSKSTLKSWLSDKFQIIEENESEKINYKSDISSNKIHCSFVKKKLRYINGIETDNKLGYYDSKELDLKKKSLVKEKTIGAAAVTGYYGGIIGGITWLILRLSEWVSANDGTSVN